MSRYSDQFRDSVTGPIAGASVYVYRQDTGALATLTSDGSTSLANPVTTDSYGNFAFYTADGLYDLRFIVGGKAVYQEDGVLVGASPYTVTSATGQTVGTRTLLAAITAPVNGQAADLIETGREGRFVFSTANNSANVTADPGQGIYVAPASDTTGASGAWVRRYVGGLRITWFGAVAGGDATANATAIQRTLNFAITLKVTDVIVPRADAPYDYTKVTIPLVAYNAAGGLQTIRLRGEAPPSTWFGTLPLAGFNLSNSGSILKTAATTGAGITVTQGSHGGYDFNWIRLEVKDLHLRTYDNPNITALDATWAQQLVTDNVIVDTGVWPTNATLPTHSGAYGIITPGRANGAFTRIKDTIVCGYYYGIKANEHTFFDYSVVNCCLFGVQFVTADHGSYANRLAIYRCQTGLTFDGSHYFECAQLDIEHAGVASTSGPDNWQIPVRDVADAANFGHGRITWFAVLGNVAGADPAFTWNGGANMEFVQLGEKRLPLAVFTLSGDSGVSSSNFSVPNNAATALNWVQSTPAECAVINGGDTTKIIISTTGTYEFSLIATYAANATGYRELELFNGATSLVRTQTAPVAGVTTPMHLFRGTFAATAADQISIKAFQNSGAALALNFAGNSGIITLKKLRTS